MVLGNFNAHGDLIDKDAEIRFWGIEFLWCGGANTKDFQKGIEIVPFFIGLVLPCHFKTSPDFLSPTGRG
jgi:hypothetical protein